MPRGVMLDVVEREQIARGIDRKWTDTAIARKLGRVQSVVSREIARNGVVGSIRRWRRSSGLIGCDLVRSYGSSNVIPSCTMR